MTPLEIVFAVFGTLMLIVQGWTIIAINRLFPVPLPLTVPSGVSTPTAQAKPAPTCTATIAPRGGGRYACALLPGHYDESIPPAPYAVYEPNDNPGGWHQSADGKYAWCDDAPGATPADAPPTPATGCFRECDDGHMYDGQCTADPHIEGVTTPGNELPHRDGAAWSCAEDDGCGHLSLGHTNEAAARRSYDRHRERECPRTDPFDTPTAPANGGVSA